MERILQEILNLLKAAAPTSRKLKTFEQTVNDAKDIEGNYNSILFVNLGDTPAYVNTFPLSTTTLGGVITFADSCNAGEEVEGNFKITFGTTVTTKSVFVWSKRYIK